MTLIQQAIQATLKGNWEEAITLNMQLLEENPKDLDTLNRLGFALTAAGKPTEAKLVFEKVLEIDNANPIAQKNLKKLADSGIKKNGLQVYQVNHDMFLEEVGKTKMVTLVNPAPPKTLRTLQVGQPLNLAIKRNKIFLLDDSNEFIGMLPDNMSRRIIKFMKGGNKYSAYVRGVEERNVITFLKEVKRAKRYENQSSFGLSDLPKQSISLPKRKHQEEEVEE